MTTRRRRAVLNAVPENENCQTTIEGPLSGIMKLIEDLENSVDERIKRFQSAAEDSVLTLKNESRRLLVTLPKKIRSMPLKKFQQEYPNDLQTGVLEQIRERYAALAEAAKHPQLALGKRAAEPGTVLRTVRAKRAPVPSKMANLIDVEENSSVFSDIVNKPTQLDGLLPAPQMTLDPASSFNGLPLQTPMPFIGAPVALPVTLLAQKRAGARTKAVAAPEAAVITTADGKQWALGRDGVVAVPETHRAEVTELLAAQFEFLAAALGKTVFAGRGNRKRMR